MNWVDLSIFALLLIFILEGMRRSFIHETLDFLSFLLAFFVSLRYYNNFGAFFESNLQIPHSVSSVLGFITSWFLTETVFFIFVHLIIGRLGIFRKIDTLLQPFSFLPALLRGLVFVAILLVVIGTFPIQPKIKQAVHGSVFGSEILIRTQNLEKPLKNVFGGITQDTLSFLTIKPKSDEVVHLGFQTENFSPSASLEMEMITLVNRERRKNRLSELVFDPNLLNTARIHSADMFKRGYFSHYSPEGKTVADRAKDNSVKYLVIGENLAYAPTLNLAHEGLMNSPGHRANILSPDFAKIAVGIMDGGIYGLMVTQVFSN